MSWKPGAARCTRSSQGRKTDQALLIVVFLCSLQHVRRDLGRFIIAVHFPQQSLPRLVAEAIASRKVLDVFLRRGDDGFDHSYASLHNGRRLRCRLLRKVVVAKQHEHLVGVHQLSGHEGHLSERHHDAVPRLRPPRACAQSRSVLDGRGRTGSSPGGQGSFHPRRFAQPRDSGVRDALPAPWQKRPGATHLFRKLAEQLDRGEVLGARRPEPAQVLFVLAQLPVVVLLPLQEVARLLPCVVVHGARHQEHPFPARRCSMRQRGTVFRAAGGAALLAVCAFLPGVCGGGKPWAPAGRPCYAAPAFVMPAALSCWRRPRTGCHQKGPAAGARVPHAVVRDRDVAPVRRARLALRQEAGADGAQSSRQDEPCEPGAATWGSTPGSHIAGGAAESAAESHLGRKTIGVDHGRKRTGVCVSVGYAPRPLPLICHDDNCTDVALQVAQIARKEGAEQIVVGFPFNSTGGEGEQAVYTRQFVSALQEACTTCAIYLWDERFSTSVAREKLQQVSEAGCVLPPRADASHCVRRLRAVRRDGACAPCSNSQACLVYARIFAPPSTLQAGYNRMDMKGLVDTVASIGILSDFFDKNGVGAEKVQDKSSVGPGGDGMGHAPLVPVLSYKERLKQMQAAATASAAAGGGKKRKKRK